MPSRNSTRKILRSWIKIVLVLRIGMTWMRRRGTVTMVVSLGQAGRAGACRVPIRCRERSSMRKEVFCTALFLISSRKAMLL